MGLAERRATKEFQDSHFAPLKKAIDDAAGFAVDLEVKWESLAVDQQSHLYVECWPKLYFTPTVEALKDVGRDAMGKDALKGGLKKVVIQNTRQNSNGDTWATWDNGVLTLEHSIVNVDDIATRTKSLVLLLESEL